MSLITLEKAGANIIIELFMFEKSL